MHAHTGCCDPYPDSAWWETQDDSTVFSSMYEYCTTPLHQSCTDQSQCPGEQPHCCAGRCVCDDQCNVDNSVSCTANGLCDDPNDVPGTCAGGSTRLDRRKTCGCGIQKVPTSCTHLSAFVLPEEERATRSTSRLIGEGWLRQTIFDFPSSRIGGSVAAATPTFEGDIKGIYIAQRYLPDQAVREVCRYAQRSVGA